MGIQLEKLRCMSHTVVKNKKIESNDNIMKIVTTLQLKLHKEIVNVMSNLLHGLEESKYKSKSIKKSSSTVLVTSSPEKENILLTEDKDNTIEEPKKTDDDIYKMTNDIE